jgi:outer membrane protein assembly factor BamB
MRFHRCRLMVAAAVSISLMPACSVSHKPRHHEQSPKLASLVNIKAFKRLHSVDEVWRKAFEGGGQKSPPIIAGDAVIVEDADRGALEARYLVNGDLKWRYQAPGMAPGVGTIQSFEYKAGRVVVYAGRVVEIDPATGAEVTPTNLNIDANSIGTIGPVTVAIRRSANGTGKDSLVGYSTQSKRVIWRKSQNLECSIRDSAAGIAVIALLGICGAGSSYIALIDPMTGHVRWKEHIDAGQVADEESSVEIRSTDVVISLPNYFGIFNDSGKKILS